MNTIAVFMLFSRHRYSKKLTVAAYAGPESGKTFTNRSGSQNASCRKDIFASWHGERTQTVRKDLILCNQALTSQRIDDQNEMCSNVPCPDRFCDANQCNLTSILKFAMD